MSYTAADPAAPHHGCRMPSSPRSNKPCWKAPPRTGFTGELWTLDRIAIVIERLTGVRHYSAHVWALLHYRLGYGAAMMTSTLRVSNAKAKADLGCSRAYSPAGRASPAWSRDDGLAGLRLKARRERLCLVVDLVCWLPRE
jgi:hypothetical protein